MLFVHGALKDVKVHVPPHSALLRRFVHGIGMHEGHGVAAQAVEVRVHLGCVVDFGKDGKHVFV